MKFLFWITNYFWNSNENRLRSFWRILLQFITMFLIGGIIMILEVIVRLALGLKIDENVSALNLSSTLAMTIGLLVTLFIFGRWVDRRPLKDFGFHFSSLWTADFIFGLSLGAILMGLIFSLELILGFVTIQGYSFNNQSGNSFIFLILESFIIFLLVGFYEESFSRGYQLHNLAEGFGFMNQNPKTAILCAWLISSSFFGLLHAANPNASLISTINLIAAGLFLGLGYILTCDLGISIGLHITWNFFQGNIFGFPVSGLTPPVSFIHIEQCGPDLITGGSFGPEAGLIGLTAIFLGSALIMLWVQITRKSIHLEKKLAIY